MSAVPDRNADRFRPRWGCLIILIPVPIALLLTAPLTVPWAVWLNQVGLCGHQPVIASDFAAGYSYALPGDPDYQPGFFPFMPTYFCTEDQAKAHGYHHEP
jgi:hypothetical protein